MSSDHWTQQNPYLATSDNGYRVGKFIIEAQAWYRPSKDGRFIGKPVSTFAEARRVCAEHHKNHQGNQQGQPNQ